MNRPRIGLDLHYLLTFYGSEAGFVPQRLLGSVVRTLHARPVLSRTQIQQALTAFPALQSSNLADDVELVKFTQLPLTLEELSKLWSVFFQTAVPALGRLPGHRRADRERRLVLVAAAGAELRNLYVEPVPAAVVEAVVAFAGRRRPDLTPGRDPHSRPAA